MWRSPPDLHLIYTCEGRYLGEVIDRVEESLATLSAIQKNQYAEPFLDAVTV